jgi:hypothetical protein
LQLEERLHWYTEYAKAYIVAAEAVWAEAHKTKNGVLSLAPLTQLLGQTIELTLKAHLLALGKQESEIRVQGHDILRLASTLEQETSILNKVEGYVSANKAVLNLKIPSNHRQNFFLQGKNLQEWYSFRLHVQSLAQSYNQELLNGDKFAARYPPKNDFIRSYSPTIIVVATRFLIDELTATPTS